jgi:type VI secretion system protein
MAVTLRVLRYLDAVPALCLDCRFDRLGGTLGRGADNAMVFEDPDKSISRLHARIEFHDGAYCLLDMGTNPSLVNGKPLGIGRRARLSDGDLIDIGHYQLVAHVESEAFACLPLSPLQAPVAASRAAGLFADSDDALAAESILHFDGTQVAAPSLGGTRSDHVPPEQAPFPVSHACGAAHPTIPDDYDPMADIPALAAGDDPVVRALLRGLGLPAQRTGLGAEELAELVGAMLRAATVGTVAALAARAATRRESRLDMTMSAVRVDNPLASCSDAVAVLAQVVGGGARGPMGPVQAYAHAFDEIEAHERASMAGMQAALSGVLACFDPAAIDLRVGKPSLMEKLFASKRKARLWDRMVALNAQLNGDAEDDFQRLFAQAFGWKYEQARGKDFS